MIGVLTFHRAVNYGAVLQAYALTEFVSNIIGQDVKVIDYHCEKIEKTSSLSEQLRSSNRFKALAKRVVMGDSLKKTIAGFDEFRSNYLQLSSSYTQINKEDIANDFEYIIVGSDQVWNLSLTGNDWTYFLDFEHEKSVGISYAASIGELPSNNYELYDLLLKNFRAISVREKSFEMWIAYNTTNTALSHIDPVFLIDTNQWDSILVHNDSLSKKYLLCYNVQDAVKMTDYIEKAKVLADENDWSVKYLSTNGRLRNKGNIEVIKSASPQQFISLIRNAEFVITDSFHGTAFSLLYHKDFYVASNIHRADRVTDLLQATGLSDRFVSACDICSAIKIVDDRWSIVDSFVESERKRSKEYIVLNIPVKKTIGEELPDLASDKSTCCGCGACFSTCPREAISMVKDEEGFLYPQIDKTLCIKCMKCIQVCLFKRDQIDKKAKCLVRG